MPAPIKPIHTKDTAEALLNELPSVMGSFVREDVNGHPREVHLLVAPGPDVRSLARDVRFLLEQRLGVPIDQRVISIAQLVDSETRLRGKDAPLRSGIAGLAAEVEAATGEAETGEGDGADERLVLTRTEERLVNGRIEVTVGLSRGETEHVGEASELETTAGRVRAGATATLCAVEVACGERLRLDLEVASVLRALDRDFVLVSVVAAGAAFGRKPMSLVGAHPVEEDLQTAAVLATLKAVNRVVTAALDDAENAAELRRRPGRPRGER